MKFAIFALIASITAVSAQASESNYAVEIIDRYNPSSGSYYYPEDALGAPDAAPDDSSGVYSLGDYGWITLRLGRPVVNITGPDLVVWEESSYFDNPATRLQAAPDEDANVYLSLNGLNWILVGQPRTGIAGSMAIDIDGKGVDGATFIKILDVSGRSYPNHNGFDLDAVTVLSVPEPATTALILTGLFVVYTFAGRKAKSGESAA